jgi:type II secretion system protein N
MFQTILRYAARKIVFWGLIPFLVIYVLIRIFQPEAYLMEHMSNELDNQFGIQLSYNDVSLGFPGRLTLKQPSVSQNRSQTVNIDDQTLVFKQRIYFSGDSLTLGVGFLPLLERKARLYFRGDAYGGKFDGYWDTRIQSKPAPLSVHGTWNNLDLALLSQDHPGLQINTGLTSGKADVTADLSKQFGYKGQINLKIENSQFNPPKSFSGDFDLPAFNSASADIILNYSEIILEDVQLHSPDTVVRLSGTVHQTMPVTNSLMDIEIRLHFISATQPFDEDMYIPFNVKGLFSDPQVFFLGRAL